MSAVERQIKEGLLIEKESRVVDNLLHGKGEWVINGVPRLQSEKKRLGMCEENPTITSICKRQAELDTDEPRASSTHIQINHNVPGLNAELTFSGQFRQRNRASKSQKTTANSAGLTRPMV